MNRILAYAQLVRLPNVFTAFADIGLGWLALSATEPSPPSWLRFILLLAASGSLYSAGMVWNDFFDVDQDRRERPFRPLPSGRVRRATAAWLGGVLLSLGLLLSIGAGWQDGVVRTGPPIAAGALIITILLYDGWLKRTWAGPLAMGTCRFLNVMLGLSLANASVWPWHVRIHLALVVGVYIVGVTWFARTEARASNRAVLTAAAAVMLSALLLALAVPVWFETTKASPLFPYLLVVFGFLLAMPISDAVFTPQPKQVQRAVKRAVLGLVVLDAVLATAFAGTPGLILLVLLIPALYLGRWVYST